VSGERGQRPHSCQIADDPERLEPLGPRPSAPGSPAFTISADRTTFAEHRTYLLTPQSLEPLWVRKTSDSRIQGVDPGPFFLGGMLGGPWIGFARGQRWGRRRCRRRTEVQDQETKQRAGILGPETKVVVIKAGCRRRSCQGLYEKLGFPLTRLRRRRGLPGDPVHPSRFGGVDHSRQKNHSLLLPPAGSMTRLMLAGVTTSTRPSPPPPAPLRPPARAPSRTASR